VHYAVVPEGFGRSSAGRPSALLPLLVVAVLAHAAITYRLLAPLWFVQDDYLNFAQASEPDTVWHFVNRLVFGHYAPTHRLASLLIVKLRPGEPLSWDVVRAVLALIGAAGAAGLALCAFALTGRPVVAGLMWLSLATSSAALSYLRWWSSALHVGAHLATVLWGWFFLLRFVEHGRYRWLVATVALWGLALGAYEKALLSTALCLGLALWKAGGRPDRKRPMLAFALAVVVLDASYLIHLVRVGALISTPVPWRDLPKALGLAFIGPFSRAAAGTAWIGGLGAAALSTATVLVSNERLRTLRLWFFAVVAALGLFVPVAVKRLEEFGTTVGLEARYVFEWWPLWLVSFALALGQLPRRSANVLLTAAALLWLISLPAQRREVHGWLDWRDATAGRAWAEKLDRSLRTASASNPPPIVEGEVSPWIVEPWYYPYSRAQVVLPLISAAHFRAVQLDADREAFALAPDGALARAAWQPLSSGSGSTLSRAGGSCRIEAVGDSICVEATTRHCRAWWRAPPAKPNAALLAIRSDGPPEACIAVEPTEDSQWGIDGSPRCSRRGTASWTWFRQREYLAAGSISAALAPGMRLCLQRWVWGRAVEHP